MSTAVLHHHLGPPNGIFRAHTMRGLVVHLILISLQYLLVIPLRLVIPLCLVIPHRLEIHQLLEILQRLEIL